MDQLGEQPTTSIWSLSDRATALQWILWFNQLQKKINELVTEIELLKKE